MAAFERVCGRAYPLGTDNIDTDVILPARFLKTITRDGLGVGAFETIRARSGNVFDNPHYRQAPLLIAGKNFGCGSSREHAVWAMMDMGIAVVIAESYSDIFSGNAFKNGLLAVVLDSSSIAEILRTEPPPLITVDLASQEVRLGSDRMFYFEIDPFRKDCLMQGLDEIALTLRLKDKIAAFEQQRTIDTPWLSVSA